jgi:hypothetical protein
VQVGDNHLLADADASGDRLADRSGSDEDDDVVHVELLSVLGATDVDAVLAVGDCLVGDEGESSERWSRGPRQR